MSLKEFFLDWRKIVIFLIITPFEIIFAWVGSLIFSLVFPLSFLIETAYMTIFLIVFYFISCIIIWIYDKVKNRFTWINQYETKKHFLIPNKRKIITFAIVLLIFKILPYGFYNYSIDTRFLIKPIVEAGAGKIYLPFIFIRPFGTIYSIITGEPYSLLNLLDFLYYYLLSCLIVWFYDKIRRNNRVR